MARKYKRDNKGRFASGGGFGTGMSGTIARGTKNVARDFAAGAGLSKTLGASNQTAIRHGVWSASAGIALRASSTEGRKAR